MVDTDDKRYLLDCDHLPEYDQERLTIIWDNLTKEYDNKSGDMVFQSHIDDIITDLDDWLEYLILKACHGLLELGQTNALEILRDEFGLEYKVICYDVIHKVWSMIRKKETEFQIEQTRDKGEKKEKGDYIESVVQMATILTIAIDPKKITVSEYIQYNKATKKLISARKPKVQWEV